ncbi:dynein light chain 1, cytoplasmic-like isoform X2 [Meleagris gallopavo]|uniref:dynein light chain 1, cytoplasmic-like isoform X2 n=1 Tax=Meleagris gallopavo TaxID=9103 RepID=UPI00093E2BED|nr:dynein light chain 1, cytoplasmic-like isoform X2 [Meleagris gallopavo]
MSDRKAVIKNADMSEEMQQDAVECATQALEKYNIEKDIAAHIKKMPVISVIVEKREFSLMLLRNLTRNTILLGTASWEGTLAAT